MTMSDYLINCYYNAYHKSSIPCRINYAKQEQFKGLATDGWTRY